MTKAKLTEQDFAEAAAELKCDVAAIKAVCEVEAPKGGFLDDGTDRPTILFERHKFRTFTGGRYDTTHPDLSNKKAGGYGPAGAHQWKRFSRAFALDAKAAMKACSWGKFQIMGFNFKSAGFNSLDDFVDAMKVSESEQLKAFVQIIKSFALDDELRAHQWSRLAAGYNGDNYKINKYDLKLAIAHKKHSAGTGVFVGSSVIDDVDLETEAETHESAEQHVDDDDALNDALAAAAHEVSTPAVKAPVPQEQKPPLAPDAVVEVKQVEALPAPEPTIMSGVKTHWAAAMGFLTSAGAGAVAFIEGLPAALIYGFFAFATIIVVAYIVQRAMMRNKAENRQLERDKMAHELTLAQIKTASDQYAYTVKVTT